MSTAAHPLGCRCDRCRTGFVPTFVDRGDAKWPLSVRLLVIAALDLAGAAGFGLVLAIILAAFGWRWPA